MAACARIAVGMDRLCCDKNAVGLLEINVQPHKCISELLYCVFLYLW